MREPIKYAPIIHRPDMMKPPARPAPTLGLGDLVAKVAQPIAGFVDKVTGSKLSGCGGCAQRQEALNRLVPDVKNPLTSNARTD